MIDQTLNITQNVNDLSRSYNSAIEGGRDISWKLYVDNIYISSMLNTEMKNYYTGNIEETKRINETIGSYLICNMKLAQIVLDNVSALKLLSVDIDSQAHDLQQKARNGDKTALSKVDELIVLYKHDIEQTNNDFGMKLRPQIKMCQSIVGYTAGKDKAE
jgi:hypothetical protein